MLKKIKIWYSPRHLGDGDIALDWYLKKRQAAVAQAEANFNAEGTCDVGIKSVQTYVGSDIYKKAKKNSDEFANQVWEHLTGESDEEE